MKTALLFGTAIVALFMCSCSSQSRDKLPSGVVEDAIEEQMDLCKMNQSYTKLQTGYFECNEEITRIKLAKLAAAGVINYKVERFAWWNKHLYAGNSYGSYFGEETYMYEEHFMVSVNLTEEGKKILVDSIPMPEMLEDEALALPDIDSTALPELNYVAENWPEIPCPEKKNKAEKKEETTETNNVLEEQEERGNVNNIFAQKPQKEDNNNEQSAWVALDVEAKTKYVAAKEKEEIQIVILKSSALEVDDVRFIQTFVQQQSGLSMAKAEVIVKTTDVTAAGRIIDHKCEGTKLCTIVNFIYFDDEGWKLLDKDFKFSPVSMIWNSLNSQSGKGAKALNVKNEVTEAVNSLISAAEEMGNSQPNEMNNSDDSPF